jgi:hypothetical protein
LNSGEPKGNGEITVGSKLGPILLCIKGLLSEIGDSSLALKEFTLTVLGACGDYTKLDEFVRKPFP